MHDAVLGEIVEGVKKAIEGVAEEMGMSETGWFVIFCNLY